MTAFLLFSTSGLVMALKLSTENWAKTKAEIKLNQMYAAL